MRTTSYKCDRCRKPLTYKSAVKLNISLQRGGGPVEKIPYDFCSKCFVLVKTAFLDSLVPEDSTGEEGAIIEADDAVAEAVPMAGIQSEGTDADGQDVPQAGPADVGPGTMPGMQKGGEPIQENNGKAMLKLGPISAEERGMIFRMHVEEGLSADEIASRMNRLPRGIKRAINSAAKSGELESMRRAFQERKEAEAAKKALQPAMDDTEDASKPNTGSGANDSGIIKDAYTVAPQKQVVCGKKYDIGCILALAKAGWDAPKIAEERNYDVDVVRMLLEEHA